MGAVECREMVLLLVEGGCAIQLIYTRSTLDPDTDPSSLLRCLSCKNKFAE